MRIGQDILEVGSYGFFFLNGVSDASLSAKMAGKHSIVHTQLNKKTHEFQIELDNDESILIRSFKDLVSVKVVHGSFNNFGKSQGLMGKFGTGEWLARNGTVLKDASAFGQEWQVRDTEAKLFETLRAPQHPAQCNMPKASAAKERRLGEGVAKKAKAEKACAHWGDMQDKCVYDVLAMADLEIAEAGVF